ncbi:MAG: BlaI/MecI/CopY family transcriptional regulator [Candidatus Eisenbacteria bacterium]
MPLPELSRFELQCLRALWGRREASVREVHGDLPDAPSYSTVRKIFERLEQKGAVKRVRLESRAWVYRPTVSRAAMVAKEVRRLLDGLFDGRAESLVAHLADSHDLSLADLARVEREAPSRPTARRRTPLARAAAKRRRS